MLYNAPRLAFFPRHDPDFEHLAQSARVLPPSQAKALEPAQLNKGAQTPKWSGDRDVGLRN